MYFIFQLMLIKVQEIQVELRAARSQLQKSEAGASLSEVTHDEAIVKNR